jgi:hypothetical protein
MGSAGWQQACTLCRLMHSANKAGIRLAEENGACSSKTEQPRTKARVRTARDGTCWPSGAATQPFGGIGWIEAGREEAGRLCITSGRLEGHGDGNGSSLFSWMVTEDDDHGHVRAWDSTAVLGWEAFWGLHAWDLYTSR